MCDRFKIPCITTSIVPPLSEWRFSFFNLWEFLRPSTPPNFASQLFNSVGAPKTDTVEELHRKTEALNFPVFGFDRKSDLRNFSYLNRTKQNRTENPNRNRTTLLFGAKISAWIENQDLRISGYVNQIKPKMSPEQKPDNTVFRCQITISNLTQFKVTLNSSQVSPLKSIWLGKPLQHSFKILGGIPSFWRTKILKQSPRSRISYQFGIINAGLEPF